MRSATSSASSISWVTSTVAQRVVATMFTSNCCIAARVTSSSAENGSSSSSACG